MNKEKQYQRPELDGVSPETIIQPPRKKEKDPVITFLKAQSLLCCLALVASVAIRLVGGEVYHTVKQKYVQWFCDTTSPQEVLDVFRQQNSAPTETPDIPLADEPITPTAVPVSDEPYGDWTDDSLALTEKTSLMNTALTSQAGNQMEIPVHGSITSGFGYRVHPIYGTRLFHNGVDIGADDGTPIVAALGGEVVTAEYNDSYGYHVIINHGGELCTVYAHCSQLLVTAGQQVAKGQEVGLVGSTGVSTGPHLHFEVRRGEYRIDPEWLVDLE